MSNTGCESVVSRKCNGRSIDEVCREKGIRYRIRRPHIKERDEYIGSSFEIAASEAVEQVLCGKHRRKALDQGFEVIPV